VYGIALPFMYSFPSRFQPVQPSPQVSGYRTFFTIAGSPMCDTP